MKKYQKYLMFNGKKFLPYDDNYYVSSDGEVYSTYKKDLLKHAIDHDGYHRVDIHGKHVKIHKMVYIAWVGNVPKGMVIRHLDDDINNNSIENLAIGTQKENIRDSYRNGHKKRSTNSHYLDVYDRYERKFLRFFPAYKIFPYLELKIPPNGGVSRLLNRPSFKKRFEVIDYDMS